MATSCVVHFKMPSLALVILIASASVQAGPPGRWEPQVAMVCREGDGSYLSQYLTPQGQWVTPQVGAKVTCIKDKVDILHHCKQVYPDKDITNIVESSHYYQVPNFCKVGHTKCKSSFWVKPYRCLEGQFQSDALLVPEGCLFDHIHNQSRCWEFDKWNTTAEHACSARSLSLKAFAMLLPCGIDVFSGVEFVCCPKSYKGHGLVRPQKMEEPLALPSVQRSTTSSTTLPPPTPLSQESGTRDSYFSRFDPQEEHDAYRRATERLEDRHREKVSKIMKEWNELEQRYQELRKKDKASADQFKAKMTHRFQSTVDAVEAENEAEKQQLSALHQQRVVAHINEMKREAMTCYTRALRDTPPSPHRVQKCLQRLLRSLNKDRHHTVAHYKHLLNTDVHAAEREREATLQHLSDLDRMTNQSLVMLSRHGGLYASLGRLMTEYAATLRRKDKTPSELEPTVPVLDESVEEEDEEVEDEKDDETNTEYDQYDDQSEENSDENEINQDEDEDSSYEHEDVETSPSEPQVKDVPDATSPLPTSSAAPEIPSTTLRPRPPRVQVSSATQEPSTKIEAVEVHQEEVVPAHAQRHSFTHQQAGYSLHPSTPRGESRGVYFTLAFAGLALMAAMVVGIIVLRRRASRHPSSQGFMEVDQNASAVTPEERHVANMQVNGYENPTYKFFEK